MYHVYIAYRQGIITGNTGSETDALRALGFNSVLAVETATYFELGCHPHTRKKRIEQLSFQLLAQRGTQEGQVQWSIRARSIEQKTATKVPKKARRVRVYVTLKPGVHSPEATEILKAVHAIGFHEVISLAKGRFYQVTCTCNTPLEVFDDMCRAYLTNPVLENWRVVAE